MSVMSVMLCVLSEGLSIDPSLGVCVCFSFSVVEKKKQLGNSLEGVCIILCYIVCYCVILCVMSVIVCYIVCYEC